MRPGTGRTAGILALLLACSSAVWSSAASAQDAEPDEPSKNPCRRGFMNLRKRPAHCDELRDRKPQYAFLPAIFVQKETSVGAAVYNELVFYTSETQDVEASRVALTFTYTVRNQFITRIPTLLYFKENDYVIDGYVDFRIYPNRYYGIGNDTSWDYQVYREDVVTAFYEFRRRIFRKLYGGLVWHARGALAVVPGDAFDESGELSNAPEDELLVVEDPAGAQPNFVQGLGVELVYDGRDDVSAPHQGAFHRMLLTYYGPYLGSEFEYLNWEVDLRQFVPLGKHHVLAFQLLSQTRFGKEIPFSTLAELGGPAQMRGYFRGRYRDEHYLTAQVEWRYPIYKRLSGVAFATAGEVYGQTPYRWDRLRWTVGGGLRFRFGKNTFMRIDGGGNPETNAVIFSGGNTF